jgi:hypothetical protein
VLIKQLQSGISMFTLEGREMLLVN